MKKTLIGMAVLCSCLFPRALYPLGMTLSEANTGTINHTVTIESTGQFRLVFNAGDNWGIDQWYDLANDPSALTNIASTSYCGFQFFAEEPGVYQQVWYGTTPNDPKLYMHAAKVYPTASTRAFSILENNPARIVVKATSSPIIGSSALSNIVVDATFSIYPDGRLYLKTNTTAITAQTTSEWRNAIIGLCDPSYMTSSDSGSCTIVGTQAIDITKNWTIDCWAGFKFEQAGYNKWEILSNTSNTLQLGTHYNGSGSLVSGAYTVGSRPDKFGFIRADNVQNPYAWHGAPPSKYIFAYWDPTTPAPYTNWTKTSIMLTPFTPYGGQSLGHDWKGFKRAGYSCGATNFTAGQTITQYHYMQFGTGSSSYLPNIINSTVANPYANDYIAPATLAMETGSVSGDGYDEGEGCYTVTASGNQASFHLDGSTTNRINTVFKIDNYATTSAPKVTIAGVEKTSGTDYNSQLLPSNVLLVQLLGTVSTDVHIDIVAGESGTAPTISSLVPNNANYNETKTIQIEGSGFFGGTATTDVTLVKLYTSPVTNVTGYSVTLDTLISNVVIPGGISSGSYLLKVTTASGGESAGAYYTVQSYNSTVTNVTPSTGNNAAATTVSIIGTGYFGGTASSSVTALVLDNGSGTRVTITGYSVTSDSVIQNAVVPSGKPAGTYDVRVTTAGGTNAASTMKFVITTTFRAQNLDEAIGYPNPFRVGGGNKFKMINIPAGSTMKIFNAGGELIRTISVADDGSMTWDGADVAVGIYIYLLQDNFGNKKKGKIALLK